MLFAVIRDRIMIKALTSGTYFALIRDVIDQQSLGESQEVQSLAFSFFFFKLDSALWCGNFVSDKLCRPLKSHQEKFCAKASLENLCDLHKSSKSNSPSLAYTILE